MPNAMYLEREALLDRIQFYESSARHFSEDQRVTMADHTDRHIAYAKARLERIDRMIGGCEKVAAP